MKRTNTGLIILLFVVAPLTEATGWRRASIVRPPYSITHSLRNDLQGSYNALKTTGGTIAYILSQSGPQYPLYQKFTLLLKKYAPWWVGGSLIIGASFLAYKSLYGTSAAKDSLRFQVQHREDYQLIAGSLVTALACFYMLHKAIQYSAFAAKYKLKRR